MMMAVKEKYGCLEGCLCQEGEERVKVLCHQKRDTFMERQKATDGRRITEKAHSKQTITV